MMPEGFRYVRSYRARSGAVRWALWEKRDGRRQRVGTATTEQEFRSWLAA